MPLERTRRHPPQAYATDSVAATLAVARETHGGSRARPHAGGHANPAPAAGPAAHPRGHANPAPAAGPAAHPRGHANPAPTAGPAAHPGGHANPAPTAGPTAHPGGRANPTPTARAAARSGGRASPVPMARAGTHPGGRAHPVPTAPWGAQRGVTLIELLVVVALLAVLAALAFPNLERLTASITRETQREHILNQFAGLGATAMLHGRDYVVIGSDPDETEDAQAALVGRTRYELDVPDGWSVLVEEPILARANGVCLGGQLTLLHAELEAIHVELEAPFCRVDAS